MPSESDMRGKIRDWLVQNDVVPREEWETGNGPADMYLGGYRTIIEVKRPKVLQKGPHAINTGSRKNETAFEQLTRMVEADRDCEQARLDEDQDAGWVGCVTDSDKWWVWEWPADGGGQQRFLDFDCKVLDDQSRTILLERFRRGTQWAPPEPFYLFESVLGELEKLYRQRRGSRETVIQRQLWLEQLRASGQPPDDDKADDLFVRHTLLILVSRLVGGVDDAAVGFVQWVPEGSSALEDLRNIYREGKVRD